jgi:hypothetical protein
LIQKYIHTGDDIMANIYENPKVRQFMSEMYLSNKWSADVIAKFQKAIVKMNSDYHYTDGKQDFKSNSIKSSLEGRTLTLFKQLMKELGFECRFNSYGDCRYAYKG